MKKLINISLYKNNKLEMFLPNIEALYKEGYIFFDNGIKTTINNKIFIRENNEYKFLIDIENKKGSYLLKNNNLLFDIEVRESNYYEDNNLITYNYLIATDEEPFKIVIEGVK